MKTETENRIDLVKRVVQAWEVAPHWSLGQLINYLQNFCTESELYNISDDELGKVCDSIVRERDRDFYTKAILFSKFKPTLETYFEIAKLILVSEEYDLIVAAIIEPDAYHALPLDLGVIVDMYFELT